MIRTVFAGALAIGLALPIAAFAQDSGNDQNKKLDIRSSVGDLHVGSDADARAAGLPLYPGARIKSNDGNDNKVNLGLLTEAFGLKLVVANYDSGDSPAKVLDYYRGKLQKYGKVLECHSNKHNGDVDINEDDKDAKSKELKCDGDNTGPVTELKVGTQSHQHVVAVEPAGSGSTFALVYVYTRGKQGDI